MPTIKFHDGRAMEWDAYRKMMLGQISPFQAVAQRQPAAGRASPTKPWAGAMDQAPPAQWDRAPRSRDQTSGGLARSYIDATGEYLRQAGISGEDLQVISSVLEKYAASAADEETLEMATPSRISVGPPRGQIGGAQDRRLALDELDQYGQPRRELVSAVPLDRRPGFSARFPGADRIRVL